MTEYAVFKVKILTKSPIKIANPSLFEILYKKFEDPLDPKELNLGFVLSQSFCYMKEIGGVPC